MWKKVLKVVFPCFLVLAIIFGLVMCIYAHNNNLDFDGVCEHLMNGQMWTSIVEVWNEKVFVAPSPTPSPTPTSNPTPTPSPTPEPTAVPTPSPTPKPTTVPTQVPTQAPTQVSVVQVETDKELGKKYYRLSSSLTDLYLYLYAEVTAKEAVTAIDCAEYGAAMVVAEDDNSRLLSFSAYDLYLEGDAGEVRVEFARNGAKLYAYEEGKPFSLQKGAVEATFSGMTDAKAYSTWVCKEHQAVYQGVLLREGYPDAEGRLGAFSTENGFDPRVLRAVRLCNTDGNRYDWVLVYCECKAPVVNQKPTGGGNGTTGGNKPSGGNGTTVKPTEPPRFAHEATPAPSGGIAHAPKPTATPTPSGEGGMDRQPTATRPKF